MTLAEVQVKWSVFVMDRLGPENFSTLQMKGHVWHRACAHLKVPGWLLVWNAILTETLPMFLSRLNEINGGCEKILPVVTRNRGHFEPVNNCQRYIMLHSRTINNGNCTEWSAILGWNHKRDFKTERARSASSIWNNKYDFRPKLHDPKFNYHFIRSILKSHNLIAQIQ